MFAGLGDTLMSFQGLQCTHEHFKKFKNRQIRKWEPVQRAGDQVRPSKGLAGKRGSGPFGRLMAGDRLEGTATCL